MNSKKQLTPTIIKLFDSEYIPLTIDFEILLSDTRKRPYSLVRHFVAYILAQQIDLKSVGYILNRDHSTIMNSRDKIKDWLIIYGKQIEEILAIYQPQVLLYLNQRIKDVEYRKTITRKALINWETVEVKAHDNSGCSIKKKRNIYYLYLQENLFAQASTLSQARAICQKDYGNRLNAIYESEKEKDYNQINNIA